MNVKLDVLKGWIGVGRSGEHDSNVSPARFPSGTAGRRISRLIGMQSSMLRVTDYVKPGVGPAPPISHVSELPSSAHYRKHFIPWLAVTVPMTSLPFLAQIQLEPAGP